LSAEAFDAQFDDSAMIFNRLKHHGYGDMKSSSRSAFGRDLYRIRIISEARFLLRERSAYPVRDMQIIDGIEIEITPDLKRRQMLYSR
jgi:hypothetical protein